MINNYYPSASFYFTITINEEHEQLSNSFQEVSGIDVNLEIEELNDPNQFKYKLPNIAKYDNLVLKRGIVSKNSKLLAWCNNTLINSLSASIRTKNIEVKLLNEKGEPIASWKFTNAWPVNMDSNKQYTTNEEYLIENLEFAYSTFTRIL